jgi:Icc-related predicted phosphoesterase
LCIPLNDGVILPVVRILAGADFHGDREVVSWFVDQARHHSVQKILLAGDLLGFPDEEEDPVEDQSIDARRLESVLMEAGCPVFYIMGNDDLIELQPVSGRLVPLHNLRVDSGDFNFIGYQYSLPWMGSDLEKPDEEIAHDLVTLQPYLDTNTVLVTHSPAHGILDPGFGPYRIGSPALRALLDTHPYRAHIHGHSHSGFGRDGAHFNVASACRKRAMLIDLVTLEHEVLTG